MSREGWSESWNCCSAETWEFGSGNQAREGGLLGLIVDGVFVIVFFRFFLLAGCLLVEGALLLGLILADVVFVFHVAVFAWSWAGPEAGCFVVGARCEDVAHGMPVHAPDAPIMGCLEYVGGPDGLCGCFCGVLGVVG